MAYDKAHKMQRRNDRNAKNAQRKVFGFAATAQRDDEERDTKRRYF